MFVCVTISCTLQDKVFFILQPSDSFVNGTNRSAAAGSKKDASSKDASSKPTAAEAGAATPAATDAAAAAN